jgi:hypothetical protein
MTDIFMPPKALEYREKIPTGICPLLPLLFL